MALITCPDCGSRVSDQAKACPRCGRPIQLSQPFSGARICPICKNKIPPQAVECIYCSKGASTYSINTYGSTCPQCHSSNIIFQREQAGKIGVGLSQNKVAPPKRKKSCLELMLFGWFYILKFVFYDWWVGRYKGNASVSASGTINRTVAVCQNCGYTWRR